MIWHRALRLYLVDCLGTYRQQWEVLPSPPAHRLAPPAAVARLTRAELLRSLRLLVFLSLAWPTVPQEATPMVLQVGASAVPARCSLRPQPLLEVRLVRAAFTQH